MTTIIAILVYMTAIIAILINMTTIIAINWRSQSIMYPPNNRSAESVTKFNHRFKTIFFS